MLRNLPVELSHGSNAGMSHLEADDGFRPATRTYARFLIQQGPTARPPRPMSAQSMPMNTRESVAPRGIFLSCARFSLWSNGPFPQSFSIIRACKRSVPGHHSFFLIDTFLALIFPSVPIPHRRTVTGKIRPAPATIAWI